MNLAAGQIADILTALRCDLDGRDHRRTPRVGLRARATIVPYTDGQYGKAAEVWVRDISASGIGLLHSTAMPRGQAFLVRLPSRGQGCICVLCTVVHCQGVGSRLFRIGAHFAGEPFIDASASHARSDDTRDAKEETDVELSRLRRAIIR